jgi:hypothetical protein
MKRAHNFAGRVLLILTIPLMIQLVISCCECIDTTFLTYTNCSLEIKNLDNSGESPVVAQTDSILRRAYGIRISISRSEGICEVIKNKSLFIQSAYATSCDCPPENLYRPLDSIISVVVTTLNDFNSGYTANSDVTDLFQVFRGNDFTGLPGYINNQENELYEFVEPAFEFDILLMSPPTIGTEHEFEVSVVLSDGRILKAQTGKIHLI